MKSGACLDMPECWMELCSEIFYVRLGLIPCFSFCYFFYVPQLYWQVLM